MSAQRLHDDLGERQGAIRRGGLERAEERFLAGEQDELARHAEGGCVEVEFVGHEPEALALPHPGAGAEDDECVVALGDGVGQGLHGLGGEQDDLDRLLSR